MNADSAMVGATQVLGCGDAWLWQRARLTPNAPALFFRGGEGGGVGAGVHGSVGDGACSGSDATCGNGDDGARDSIGDALIADASCGEPRCYDYAALVREAESVALRLLSLGIGRGDRVAVRMASHPRLVVLVHAAQKIGAVLVPLNTHLGAAEIGPLLAHAEPRLLLLDEAASRAYQSASLTPSPICLGVHADLDRVAIAKTVALPSQIDPQTAWMIVYTSGTTALPKGVVLTSANHFAAAAASRQRLGHGAADVWLATLPLYHVGGLAILARAVIEGSRVDLEDGFDAERVRCAIENGPATMISLVPTMLARLIESLRGPAHARLRCLLIGGAALSPALAQRALASGLPIAATYGLSEACSQLCTTLPGSADAGDGCVGAPLPGVEVRIDSAGADGVGELLARGANVSGGYFRNDGANTAAFGIGASADANTAKTPTQTAWLRTGDLASVDTLGRVHIACRRTDLIVSGGENVAPAEVEALLEEHSGVGECAVFGIDDHEWGQRVVALVALRPGAQSLTAIDADQLRHWCRARLAAFKTPRLIRFVTALPRNAGGKVDRRALAQAWEDAVG